MKISTFTREELLIEKDVFFCRLNFRRRLILA